MGHVQVRKLLIYQRVAWKLARRWSETWWWYNLTWSEANLGWSDLSLRLASLNCKIGAPPFHLNIHGPHVHKIPGPAIRKKIDLKTKKKRKSDDPINLTKSVSFLACSQITMTSHECLCDLFPSHKNSPAKNLDDHPQPYGQITIWSWWSWPCVCVCIHTSIYIYTYSCTE